MAGDAGVSDVCEVCVGVRLGSGVVDEYAVAYGVAVSEAVPVTVRGGQPVATGMAVRVGLPVTAGVTVRVGQPIMVAVAVRVWLPAAS